MQYSRLAGSHVLVVQHKTVIYKSYVRHIYIGDWQIFVYSCENTIANTKIVHAHQRAKLADRFLNPQYTIQGQEGRGCKALPRTPAAQCQRRQTDRHHYHAAVCIKDCFI